MPARDCACVRMRDESPKSPRPLSAMNVIVAFRSSSGLAKNALVCVRDRAGRKP